MLGYCSNKSKLWSPEEYKILYGRDIVFNEEKFEFESIYVETTVPLDEKMENSELKDTEQQNTFTQDMEQTHTEEIQSEVNDEETESD